MSLLSAPWQVSLAFSGITMGRHVAFATSAADEESLLQFLRASTDIQIFASFAPSSEELQVDGLAPYGPNAMQYAIWNKKYAWKPKYGRVDPEVGGHGGWFFVENTDQGPVIKLSRTNIEGFLQKDLATHQYGGIWWGPTIGSRVLQSGSTQSFDGYERTARTFARSYHSPCTACRMPGSFGRLGAARQDGAAAEQNVAPDCGGITVLRSLMFTEPPQQVNWIVSRTVRA